MRVKTIKLILNHLVHNFSFYKSNEYLILSIKPTDDKARIREKTNALKNNWLHLVAMNTSKVNYICNGKNELPNETDNQKNIFHNQLSKYVATNECSVAILNAFPIFLYEYFGKKIIQSVSDIVKSLHP